VLRTMKSVMLANRTRSLRKYALSETV
jgi:hypothetical protein